MSRKILIETDKFPYHVFNRSNNKEFFYLSNDLLWPIFLDKLKYIKENYKCEIHQFVLMSNHYHLMISTPEENLSGAMTYFHREVARCANKSAGRINHFFGGRYKWCLIHDDLYYWNAVKYIFRNPVEAGICGKPEFYKYSSLHDKNELWNLTDFFFDKSKKIELDKDWLNEPFKDKQKIAIQKALRRREFKLPRDKNSFLVNLDAMLRRKVLGTF